MKKIYIIILSVFIVISSVYMYQRNSAKNTLSLYLQYLSKLNFKEANTFLIKKKEYTKVPEHVKNKLSFITEKSSYNFKRISFININEILITTEEKIPLTFDIISSFKKKSGINLNKLEDNVFKKYVLEILKHDIFYEYNSNDYVLKRIEGDWKIIPKGKNEKN